MDGVTPRQKRQSLTPEYFRKSVSQSNLPALTRIPFSTPIARTGCRIVISIYYLGIYLLQSSDFSDAQDRQLASLLASNLLVISLSVVHTFYWSNMMRTCLAVDAPCAGLPSEIHQKIQQ